MISLAALGSFLAVVGLLTVTPGLDTAVILRTAVAGSPRRAWGVVAGIQGGTLIWGVLTSAGITALLTASHLAYEILRWAGACYLIGMGLSMLWAARKDPPPAVPAEPVPAFLPGLRRGLLTNLLNPKVGVFYVALLPQFVPRDGSPFLMGVLLTGVHIVLGTGWSGVLVALATRVRTTLEKPLARRVLDAVAGTVIGAFGIRLAADA